MPFPTPTRHPVPACALVLLLAGPAAADPGVRVEIGFGGLVRRDAPAHAWIDVTGGAEPARRTVRIAELVQGRPGLTHEIPLEIPAGARQSRAVTFWPPAALGLGRRSLAWSVDGSGWSDLGVRAASDAQHSLVAVLVTDRGTGFPALREVVDPLGQGVLQAPAIPPERTPADPAAWEAADLIVVDGAVAERLSQPAWQAISDRVVMGARLLLHGAERTTDAVPRCLLAGVPTAAGPGTWSEPDADRGVTALALEPLPGASRPVIAGAPQPWAASRPCGRGRVTTVGLDLRALRAPVASQVDVWLPLLGVRRPGHAALVAEAGGAVEAVRELPQGRRGFSRTALERIGMGVLVLLTGGLLAVFWVGRRPAWTPRLAWALPAWGAVLSLPLFVGGAASRIVEDARPLVVEEVFAAVGRRRVSRLLEDARIGAVVSHRTLPAGSIRLYPRGASQGGQGATIRLADPPVVDGFRIPAFSFIGFQADTWESAGPVAEWADGSPSAVRNTTGEPLDEACLLKDGQLLWLGALPPGEAVPAGGGAAPPSGPSATLSWQALEAFRRRGERGPVLAASASRSRRGLLVRSSDHLLVVHLAGGGP